MSNKKKIEIIDEKGISLGEGVLKNKIGDGKILIAHHYRGPLPPAKELEKYSKLHTKFVSILLKEFKENSKFQRDINTKALDGSIKLDNNLKIMVLL